MRAAIHAFTACDGGHRLRLPVSNQSSARGNFRPFLRESLKWISPMGSCFHASLTPHPNISPSKRNRLWKDWHSNRAPWKHYSSPLCIRRSAWHSTSCCTSCSRKVRCTSRRWSRSYLLRTSTSPLQLPWRRVLRFFAQETAKLHLRKWEQNRLQSLRQLMRNDAHNSSE